MPQCDSPDITMPLSGPASACEPLHAVPSGDEMVEDRGVPVHEDWSMAPDDDRVRFSLSGVAPHSWKRSPQEGWDRRYSAWTAHLLQAFSWMEEEPEGATAASLSSPKSPPTCCPVSASAPYQHVLDSAHLLMPGWGSPPGDPQLRLSARLLILLFGQDGGVL